jgi:hypothetical protein
MLRSTLRYLARGLTRRPAPARKAPRARSWKPSLDELESRFAPAIAVSIQGGILTAQADAGSNTVTVDHVVKAGKGFAQINGHRFSDAAYKSIRINGGAGGTVTNIHANVKPLTVLGASAKDVVNLGDTANHVQGIQGTVLLEDEKGFKATVNINDQADTTNPAATLSTVTRPGASSLGQLTGLSGPISWDYADTSAVNLHLGTGTSTVNVNGTGPLTTNISTAAQTAIFNVGNGNVAANIQGKLNLQALVSGAAVNILDNNDNQGQTATLSTVSRLNQSSLGQLSGLGAGVITWDSLSTGQVSVVGGIGADTFNIQGITVATTVTGNAPAIMNVGSGGSVAGIQSLLFLKNNSGPNNTVNINSQNDTAQAGLFAQGSPSSGVDFFSVQGISGDVFWDQAGTAAVNLNSGSTNVNVQATVVTTNIFSNANATIDVGNNGSVAGIQGALNLANTAGTHDTVNINDQKDAATQTAVLSTLVGAGGNSLGVVRNLGAAQITWDATGNPIVNLNLGHGASTVDVLGTDVTTNIFNSAAATINVGDNGSSAGSVAGIQGPLNLKNTAGALDTVNINDQNDNVAQTVDLSTFTAVGGSEGALIGLGAAAQITWGYSSTSAVNLNLGIGAGTVDVFGTGVTTNIFNSAAATINVGSDGTFDGNVALIQGTLNLANITGALDTVNIDDQSDSGPQAVSVGTITGLGSAQGTVVGLSGAAPINWDFASTLAVNLRLGTGASSVNVLSTGVTTNIFNKANTTINVGNGDTVAGIQGALNLENEPAFDTINLNSQVDTDSLTVPLTVTLSTITRPGDSSLGAINGLPGGAQITYDYFDTSVINLNLGAGTIDVKATGVTTNITNSASTHINVGSNDGDSGVLAGIRGALNVNNVQADAIIDINDSGDPTGQFYSMDSLPGKPGFEQITSGAFGLGGSISFENFNTINVSLFGGFGGNTFDIFATGTNTDIFGGDGANTFNLLPRNSLGLDFVSRLALHGGINPSTLNLNDQNDLNAETFNFEISQAGTGFLGLGSSAAFDLSFFDMRGGVNLFTNAISRVIDPSNTVHVQ